MTARGGQNLLQGALRIHASGRPQPARLHAMLVHMDRALDLTSATLFLPDSTQHHLSRLFSSTLPAESRACRIPFGSGCAGRCAATVAPVVANAAEAHPDEARAAGELLGFPVRQGTKLLGVLSLARDGAPLDSSVKREISGVLPLFATLLEQLAGEEERRQRERHLHLVSELSRLKCLPLTANKLLPHILRLCNASGLSRCAMLRITEGPKHASVFKSALRGAAAEVATMVPLEAKLSRMALEQGVPLTEQAVKGAGYPCLCLPLKIAQSSFGTLTLCGEAGVHEPRQRELAETVGRLVTTALAEAISSERIASFCSDNDKKLKELSLLYRMSNTMLSTIKLNKLIHLTLTALTSSPTPFFDRAMLFLTNERSGVLQGMLGVTTETAPPLSSHGSEDILASRWDISEEDMAAQRESEFSKQVRGNRLELNRSLNAASKAVLEKKLILIPAEKGEGPCTAYAVAPLIAHGKVVGAVSVDNALTGAAITQEDLRFLQLFTNQAGMAIENSILYNRLEDANRQLCETQEHLLQKERLAAIGEMAAGIAHELKNPLVAIGGFAGRLTRKLQPESAEWSDADLIVREVMRLEGILSEILFFAKKSGTCYTRCELKEIVRESLQVIAPALEEKKIRVTTRFSRRALPMVGDAQQLKQVFINILTNARDAMSEGGEIKVRLAPVEFDGAEGASVRISDNGGGIPLEALHSIFTPFYTTKEKGTGLGLPIANRIIINHGGKIQVQNKPGVGAEFNVLLPLQS